MSLTTYHDYIHGPVKARLDSKYNLIDCKIQTDNDELYIYARDLHTLRQAIDELDDLIIKGGVK